MVYLDLKMPLIWCLFLSIQFIINSEYNLSDEFTHKAKEACIVKH